ncbi:hypothetical protein KC19_9G048500, partial [Ceratodon purpureus]
MSRRLRWQTARPTSRTPLQHVNLPPERIHGAQGDGDASVALCSVSPAGVANLVSATVDGFRRFKARGAQGPMGNGNGNVSGGIADSCRGPVRCDAPALGRTAMGLAMVALLLT